jgi:hypothetical protein
MIERKGRVHRSIGGGVLIGVATAISSAAGAGSGDMTPITVTCSAGPRVSPDWADRICTEFLAVLTAQRKGRPVELADRLQADQNGLAVMVEAANDSTVGLQLTWHPQGAAPIAARPLALSVMDRTTTEIMRADFYRRVLADAAMPF